MAAAHRCRYPFACGVLRNAVGVRPSGGDGARRSAGRADLVVHVGDVPLDGTHAQDQLLGDVAVGHPARDEPQDLGLAG